MGVINTLIDTCQNRDFSSLIQILMMTCNRLIAPNNHYVINKNKTFFFFLSKIKCCCAIGLSGNASCSLTWQSSSAGTPANQYVATTCFESTMWLNSLTRRRMTLLIAVKAPDWVPFPPPPAPPVAVLPYFDFRRTRWSSSMKLPTDDNLSSIQHVLRNVIFIELKTDKLSLEFFCAQVEINTRVLFFTNQICKTA